MTRNELMDYASDFNRPGEAFIHTESKDGCTEVLLSGDGITIIFAATGIIRRIADKIDVPLDKLISDLKTLTELNKKTEPERVIENGDFIPYDAMEDYQNELKTALEDEYRMKQKDLDKERQQYIEELKKKDIKVKTLMSRIDEQRETFAREKKALDKMIRSREATIRRMEKALVEMNDKSGAG